MASADELAALRRSTATVGDATYTDQLLSDMIDALGSVSAAAAQVWREKAAATAGMVDTTESGSSRKLSDIHKNYLDLASDFTEVDTEVRIRRSFTTPVERQ